MLKARNELSCLLRPGAERVRNAESRPPAKVRAFSRELPSELLVGRAGRPPLPASSCAALLRTAGGTAEAWSFVPVSGRRAYFFVLSRKGAFVYEGTTRKNPAGSAGRAGECQGRGRAGRAARALSRQKGRTDRRPQDDGQAIRGRAPGHGSGREQRPRRH